MSEGIVKWPRAAILALQTLTRMPAPALPAPPSDDDFGRSAVFYPLVGGLLGLSAWLVWGLSYTLWPTPVGAALTLLWLTLATGALHEDGLADAADAFGSQPTREGLHRVLKDSRVGTFGAVALIAAYLLRWSALTAIDPPRAGAALAASQVISRTGLLFAARWSGAAGVGSGAALIGGLNPARLSGAGGCCLLILALIPARPAVWALVAAAVIAALAARYFRRRLGGATGDCLGAVAVLQEIATLLCFAAA